MPAPSKRSVSQSNTQTTDTDLKYQLQELGWFGKIFGSKQQAAIALAGGTGAICAVGLIVAGIYAPSGTEKSDLMKYLSTISISALTFLGGIVGSREGR